MFFQAGLGLEQRDLMLGHASKTIDSHYSNSAVALDFALSRIQDDLDKHVLKRPVLDETGHAKLDDDGKPLVYGVTLLQYAKETEGMKLTNTEIFKDGLSNPPGTRQSVAKVKVWLKRTEMEIDDRLANDKALVIKYQQFDGAELEGQREYIGYMTLGEAANLTSCHTGELSELDSSHNGIMAANGYLFFSQKRLERIFKKHNREFSPDKVKVFIHLRPFNVLFDGDTDIFTMESLDYASALSVAQQDGLNKSDR